jgi:prepilin-type N-terminal cleavage/methylation domain-containing protein
MHWLFLIPRQNRHRASARRQGFSLIEMLMVITCLAIMAGVVIPQVSGAVDDAKHGAMLGILHEVTNAIERYRMDHTGSPPDLLVARSLPQLTSKTNVDGDIGTGPGYIYGPYLTRLPENPLNETSNVYTIASAPPANLDRRVGWVYHPDSGQIWAGLHVGAAPTGAVLSAGTN